MLNADSINTNNTHTGIQPHWVNTQDGSLTLFDPNTGEHYHNLIGAYTEAYHQYVLPSGCFPQLESERLQQRLWNLPRPTIEPALPLVIVDVCFGLGYNTFAFLQTWLTQRTQNPDPLPRTIHVLAFETDVSLFRLLPQILGQPCFDALSDLKTRFEHNDYYQTLQDTGVIRLESPLGTGFAGLSDVLPTLVFELRAQDFRECLVDCSDWDAQLLFYDPFSPKKAPELWEPQHFVQAAKVLHRHQGRLLTYSLARVVKDGLTAAGLQWCKTPKLGFKSGGLVAGGLKPL